VTSAAARAAAARAAAARADAERPDDRPGLTACALCAGETLGDADPLPGGQLARLRALAESGVARLTTVDCLDECERGDVVVARPSARRRGDGAGPVWFERLAGPEVTAELGGWLRAGGPGAAPVPGGLVGRVVERATPEV
jgi:(2Fe-2S) ferredoxin